MNASLPRQSKMRAGLAAALMTLVFMTNARAGEPVKGDIRIETNHGYARLVFKLDEVDPARVRFNWPILVLTFDKPISIPVDRLSGSAPDYISAARLDPDGSAIRIALKRKVKINTIPAAERLYVDLLPENWSGVLPGLPQEVIEELAQRAREADRVLHRERAAEKRQGPSTIRVKVARQPTFTRYVFEMPETANVVPERGPGRLTLNFDQPITWDLADALAALPHSLKSIGAERGRNSISVAFMLNGSPAVRTFQEDRSIVVDIGHDGAKASGAKSKPATKQDSAAPAIAQPETVPVAAPLPTAQPPAAQASAEAPADQAAKDGGLPPLVDVPAPKSAPPAARKAQVPKPAPPSPALPKIPLEARAVPPPAVLPPITSPPSEHKPPAKPAAKAEHLGPPPDPTAPVVAAVHAASDSLRVAFPFAVPTPAAAFTRADMLWLVFDTAARVDIKALTARGGDVIRSAVTLRDDDGGTIVRIRLKQPRLVSLDSDGPAWTVTLAGAVTVPTHPLVVARSAVGKNRANIVIPFEGPAKLHYIADPEVGDHLLVVTALAPARGFVQPQDYVELRTLASVQGVVVRPIADDVVATLDDNKITLSRPSGLSLSTAAVGEPVAASGPRSIIFDSQVWGFNRKAKFQVRQSELMRRAADAAPNRRRQARFNLARFYLSREMSAEALGVLDVALDDPNGASEVTGSVLKAIASVMLHRPDEALKELSDPQIGNKYDAPVWRAIAYARQGKWTQARADFKHLDMAMATLPIELQRMAMMEALRTEVAVRDFNSAAKLVNEFETVGVPPDIAPSYAVLQGRVDEGLGRTEDALASYRKAAASTDRRAAAQGRLREIELRFSMKEMPRKETITALETLTTVWRGDETETEGLKLLAQLYTEDGRYRDAFHVMRTALLAHPNSDLTRQIQDAAAATFDSLFLSHKGDALPPIEALGLFYDYRELTPIGRRGDEMIRRLADRLVAVDLLDQAAELLQHQVDHRLEGAARAQVATRLAVIYLMNHKPDRALATLRSTRTAELADALRDQRLLLEARALSDGGRHDLALEVIANVKGREAIRLRADILWAAKHWRQAAEQIELLYGERWKAFAPLTASERFDILRAAIAYSLSDETIGLARFRKKYAPKMAKGPEAHAFAVVTAPIGTASAQFQDVAKRIAGTDTLDAFLRDMRARFPDTGPAAGEGADKQGASADATPKPEKPDTTPTGSIGR
jgi:tetratricopeptide (TPR) repeat protein